METVFEVFVRRLRALAADQLNALSRFCRRVLTRGCQIRNNARRGRDRLHTLASIRTMTNNPITFVEEPQPAARDACNRLHTGQFTDEANWQLVYQESVAQGFNYLSVDHTDKIHIIEASNGGNLYGGNGTKGNKISNDVGPYTTNNDGTGITTSNGGNFYGGNGTKGKKMVWFSNPMYNKNNDEIRIANDAGNAYYDTVMAIDDDIFVIDVDAMSTCASTGGDESYKMSIEDGYVANSVRKANNIQKMKNNASYVNIAAEFDNFD